MSNIASDGAQAVQKVVSGGREDVAGRPDRQKVFPDGCKRCDEVAIPVDQRQD